MKGSDVFCIKVAKFQKTMLVFVLFLGTLVFSLFYNKSALAADGDFLWSQGVHIGVAEGYAGDKDRYRMLPDTNGGAVVVWTENEVRAQRVDQDGNLLWGPDGVVVSNADGAQKPVAALDNWLNTGGLIVAWSAGEKIYAQRLNPNGQKLWGAGGVAIFSGLGPVGSYPGHKICGDGVGGAYIGWRNRVVYIDREGNLPYGGINGIEIAQQFEVEDFSLISDGTGGFSFFPEPTLKVGGAYAAWFHHQSRTVRAQRILKGDIWSFGGVTAGGPLANDDGRTNCRDAVPVAKDADNGVILAWWGWNGFSSFGNGQIRVQKLNKFGTTLWASEGVVVLDIDSVGGENLLTWWQLGKDPVILSNESGGAFLAWSDYRADVHGDLYAQKIGSVNGSNQWAANGVRIFTPGDDLAFSGSENFPMMVIDGIGGVLMGYHDYTDNGLNIAATRLDMNGLRIWSRWLNFPSPCYWADENCQTGFQIVRNPSYNWAIILSEGNYGDLFAHKLEVSSAPPINDECIHAGFIPENMVWPSSFHQSLYWASNDGSATIGNAGQPDIWYRFAAPSFGSLRVNTCGTNDLFGIDTGVDTVLSLHSGCPGTTSNELVVNDDWYSGGRGPCIGKDDGDLRDSSVIYDMSQGEEILVRVTRFNASTNGMVRTNVSFTPVGDYDGDGYTVEQGDCNDNDSSIYPGAPELCDGKDNDCNPATADGSGESWYGTACDGPDTDLCKEGILTCSGGQQICTDNTGDNIEICDGVDNDCNPATADGSGESWYGTSTNCGTGECEREGQLTCSGGIQHDTCVEGQPAEEVCDGIDNDCDGLVDEEGVCDNTPAGQDIHVEDEWHQASVTFDSVLQGGDTTFATGPCGGSVWEGFTLIPADNPMCVEIETTAVFAGSVMVCMNYDDTGLTLDQEQKLVMIHCNDQGKCSMIPCDPPKPVDTVNNVVCGCTDTFSIFGVGFWEGCNADLDYDGDVDGKDLSDFINAYGTASGHPAFIPHADFDGSGTIDAGDIPAMGRGLGADNCPMP